MVRRMSKATVDLKTRQRIAANLRRLRHEHGFDSVSAMARAAGVSRAALNRYLNGERTTGLDVLLLVHRRLRISLDALCDRDPPKEWFEPDYEGPAS
jgi:transcriptional regulator with XRE-family HTH domain